MRCVPPAPSRTRASSSAQATFGWADVIFCMEKSHLSRLRRKFPEALAAKRVVTLYIRDDYEFMQPALLDELRSKLGAYIELPDA